MLAREVLRPLFCEMAKEVLARKAYIVSLFDDQKSNMGVYQIRCLVDGRVYVGGTLSFRKRWSEHRRTLNGNQHHCRLLQWAWNKYGCRNFVWEVLEYVYSNGVLGMLEDEYIMRLKSADRRFGFNGKPSSDCQSEETRKKISASNLGKKMSEEAKQKMREAKLGNKHRLGKKHGEETKRKCGEVNLGRKLNEETRQRMSETRLGRKHREESKQKMREVRLKRRMRDSVVDGLVS